MGKSSTSTQISHTHDFFPHLFIIFLAKWLYKSLLICFRRATSFSSAAIFSEASVGSSLSSLLSCTQARLQCVNLSKNKNKPLKYNKMETTRYEVEAVVSWLLIMIFQQHANCVSAYATLYAATWRCKLQIKLATSPCHSILTPSQPFLRPTL